MEEAAAQAVRAAAPPAEQAFDLEAYAANYVDSTKIARLRFIAERCAATGSFEENHVCGK